MSAPWDQTTGFGVNTLSNPYDRMMNTSGIGLRDHAGSMVSYPGPTKVRVCQTVAELTRCLTQDLCYAALQFATETLKNGGHFVCKFYQGSEDKELEKRLRRVFSKVHREKPESSRKVSSPVPDDYTGFYAHHLKQGFEGSILCGTASEGR